MRIAALVPAAGRSRRFGARNKLLTCLEGQSVIQRTIAAVAAAGFDETIVVTGPDHDAIAHSLRGAPVRLVRCPDQRDGMGYSIAAGVASLHDGIAGIAIVPGDMPLMRAATLQALIDAFVAHAGRRIVHASDGLGAQRNPVIWPPDFFAGLRALQGDRGAKAMIRDAVPVRVPDERELLDIDDEDTFTLARQALTEKPAQF